jgi:phosphoribosylformylglycinamidine (FGAM) synthase PurS component
MDPAMNESEARVSAEKIAGEVLANPVIEDYRVEVSS